MLSDLDVTGLSLCFLNLLKIVGMPPFYAFVGLLTPEIYMGYI
jgi:hypothetical protein